MKEEAFEKVEKHLYRRIYQTNNGWATSYIANFVDWKGVRRKFALGDQLDAARDRLGELRNMNRGRYDWDAEKRERESARKKAMTLSEWLDRYLMLTEHMPSHVTKEYQCAHLKSLLGHLPLSEISKVRVMEYKARRLSEGVVGATVNREVSCLTAALNLAAAEGLCDAPSKVKKERETPRDRILTEQEYQSILDASPRWLQRVAIAANEAALDRAVLLRLTWDCIHDRLIKVKGGRDKTGVEQRVGISPALNEVLAELRAEYRKTPNTDRRIFTRDGKPIGKDMLRFAFDKAVQDAKVEDFQLRDFRHCARTRWAANGLPFEVAETGIGHTLRGIAGRYVNLTDDQIRKAFQKMFPRCSRENESTAEDAPAQEAKGSVSD